MQIDGQAGVTHEGEGKTKRPEDDRRQSNKRGNPKP